MNKKIDSQDSLVNMVDSLINSSLGELVGSNIGKSAPAVNVVEAEDGYKVLLAAPGYKKEDFTIEVRDDRLHVSSEVEAAESEYITLRTEFHQKPFTRSFGLAADIDREKIEATYSSGILSVQLSKLEKAKNNSSITVEIH